MSDNTLPWLAKGESLDKIILAAQFWHSAFALCEEVKSFNHYFFFEPISHLLAHTCELALKHFLLQCSFSQP